MKNWPNDLTEAAFRYHAIAPLLDPAVSKAYKRAYRSRITSQCQEHPTRGNIRISARTLRRWVKQYRLKHMEGLRPKSRRDTGPRILTEDSLKYVETLIEENRRRDSDFLIRELEFAFPDLEGRIKRSTLNRHLRERGVLRRILPQEDSSGPPYRAFEASAPNLLWHSDVHHGPRALDDKGKVISTKIIAWIDDFSRVCCHVEAYPDETLPSLEDCLKKAMLKFGIPQRTYSDRGAIYSGVQFSLICSDLGVIPILTRPYAPWANGKAERFWRLLEDDLLSEIALLNPMPLKKVNHYLTALVQAEYHPRVHSQTEEAPLERWKSNVKDVRYPTPEQIQKVFWLWERRTVSSTGTLQFSQNTYHTDPALAERRVIVRYDPFDLQIIHLWDTRRPYVKLAEASATKLLVSRQDRPPRPKDAPKPSSAALRRLQRLEERFCNHLEKNLDLIRFEPLQEVM